MPFRRCPVAVLILFLTLPAPAQDAKDLLLSDVSVVDVAAGKLEPGRSILVRDGLIARMIGPGEAVPDGEARRLEGGGLYVIPGLFDAHVHFLHPETFGPLCIANGVLFVRDMGQGTERVLAVREQSRKREVLGPEMIAAGAIIDGDPPVWPFSEVAATPEAGRAAVRRLAEAGVDFVKVYTRLKKEVYEAIAAEACERGLPVAGHIPSSVDLDAAMAAGQISCEHFTGWELEVARALGVEGAAAPGFSTGFRYWPRFGELKEDALDPIVKRIRESGMAQVPTLVVIERISSMKEPATKDDPRLAYVPYMLESFWRSRMYAAMVPATQAALAPMKLLLARLHRAGVPLLCGTDLANPYLVAGFSLHDEMALWQEAGIPAADILRSATLGPAKRFGLAARVGTLAPGRTASFVVLRKNPLEDIRNAAAIEGVCFRGTWYGRAGLDAMLEDVKRKAGREPKAEAQGTVVAKGRHVELTGGAKTAEHRFTVTRDEAGWHVSVEVHPIGPLVYDETWTAHFGADGALREALSKVASDPPVETRWNYGEGRLRISVRSGAEAPREYELACAAAPLIDGLPPAALTVLFATRTFAMREFQSFDSVFVPKGAGEPQLIRRPFTREADVDFAMPDGSERPARLFTSKAKPPTGASHTTIWADEQGVVLKLASRAGNVSTEYRLEPDDLKPEDQKPSNSGR